MSENRLISFVVVLLVVSFFLLLVMYVQDPPEAKYDILETCFNATFAVDCTPW